MRANNTLIMRKNFLIILLLIPVLFGIGHTKAEEIDPLRITERRAKLERELKALEAQIESYRGLIQEKQREATSLERDIAILDAKIAKAKLGLRARDLRINELTYEIQKRSNLVDDYLRKIEREKQSLAELLRKTNELDSLTMVELVFGYEKLSDFFTELGALDSIQKEVQVSFAKIREAKLNTEKEIDELEKEKAEQVQLRAIQELEKRRLEEDERERQRILKITKGQEAVYQKILSSRQRDAAKIRSELFMLRGTKAIPFEKAVEYAHKAWKATGVRPAFLLGVIAEESNLGENVGRGNWKTDLAHYRCSKQRKAFLKITNELGLNPDAMPVSKRAWYGYCGGAMGPAQFMPSTWLLYQSAIARYTGHNPPNPWDPEDAFMAAALLLKDNGAAAGGYYAERRAALRYLAGGNWKKPSYAFYGDDVMELAAKYQRMIDTIRQ